MLVQWKDGSTTWNYLKDVEESYPVQLDEYPFENGYPGKPIFAWWVKFVMNKHDRILSKIRSNYWVRNHKYGIRLTKDVRKSNQIDTDNENTLW